MEPVLDLEIPAVAQYVGITRLVVGTLVAGLHLLVDERIEDLKLAVSEACTNAVEAHARQGQAGPIKVTVYETPRRVEVHVRDHGGGFDPGALPAQPLPADPERLNFERGLGIPLIRSLVDEVEFASSGDGTTVRMVMFGADVDVDAGEFDPFPEVVLDKPESV